MIVDAHVHALEARDAQHPRAVSDVFPAERSEPVELLLGEMDRAGVRAAVLVSLPGQERWIVEQLAGRRERLAGVIVLDGREAWPDARTLARWRAAGVRGLRLTALRDAGGRAALAARLAQAADAGLLVSCFVPGEEAAALDALVAKLPAATFVLNHCALPRGAAHADRLRRPSVAIDWDGDWREHVLRLLDRPNVRVCLSGGYAFADGPPPYEPVLRWARTLLERCGAERLMLGSDWPWIRPAPGYRAELDAFAPLLADLDRTRRSQIEHATASTLYLDSSLPS